MKLGKFFVSCNVAELGLETAKETLHEAVLPGAGSCTAAQRNLKSVAGQLVFVAEIFCALVGMQNGWRWIFAECVEQCGVRQLATVTHTEPPTDHLPGFEV